MASTTVDVDLTDEVLAPMETLSKTLQNDKATVADAFFMVDSSKEMLESYCYENSEELKDICTSQNYKGVALRGNIPTFMYRRPLVDAILKCLDGRFTAERDFYQSMNIVNFVIWPEPQDKNKITAFGESSVKCLIDTFSKRFREPEELMMQWRKLKTLIYQRYRKPEEVEKLQWAEVNKAMANQGVEDVLSLVDLILSLPPTSVCNERSFSHMKLIKGYKRSRLTINAMTEVMIVKTLSPSVENFDPEEAIVRFLDENKINESLQFHDGGYPPADKAKTPVQTHTFTDFPNTAASDEEEDMYDKSQLLKEEKAPPSFWTFEYYQQFFDVETHQVLHRILGSMVPRPNSNYLKSQIRPNPDLYGPFWICTTLVFTTAIAGNMANYLSSGGKDYQWRYDFHKVTFAATAIFSYWWLLPGAIFGTIWWRGSQAGYTFLEILCVYGYSLAIYIPISMLWVVQIDWFQWILVIVGASLSGGVLVLVFWPAFKEDNKKIAWTIIVVIFLFHACLAVGFKLYFFHVPVTTIPSQNVLPTQKTNHSSNASASLQQKSQVLSQKSSKSLGGGEKASQNPQTKGGTNIPGNKPPEKPVAKQTSAPQRTKQDHNAGQGQTPTGSTKKSQSKDNPTKSSKRKRNAAATG